MVDYKKTAQEKLNSNQHEFVPIVEDLVEKIWKDRPDPPLSKVDCILISYAGFHS